MNDPGQSGWDAVLDAMERRLVIAQRLLEGDEVYMDHFALPAGLGPLPARHRSRATAILEATRQVEDRVSASLEAVGARIARSRVPAGHEASRPKPSYVDRTV